LDDFAEVIRGILQTGLTIFMLRALLLQLLLLSNYFYYCCFLGGKNKSRNQVAGVALVQFDRNCKGSFKVYQIVALDHQEDSLE